MISINEFLVNKKVKESVKLCSITEFLWEILDFISNNSNNNCWPINSTNCITCDSGLGGTIYTTDANCSKKMTNQIINKNKKFCNDNDEVFSNQEESFYVGDYEYKPEEKGKQKYWISFDKNFETGNIIAVSFPEHIFKELSKIKK